MIKKILMFLKETQVEKAFFSYIIIFFLFYLEIIFFIK